MKQYFVLAIFLWSTLCTAQQEMIESFDSLSGWRAFGSDGVEIHISTAPGFLGNCLMVEYDFHNYGGYCIIQKHIPLTLPPNYILSYYLKGDAPVNNLEFKFLDENGENVWWHFRRAFELPKEWTKFTTKQRNVQFAWGPFGGGDLKEFKAIEFAISSVKGGKGTLYFDELMLESRLPAVGQTVLKVLGTPQIIGFTLDSIRVDERKYIIERAYRKDGSKFLQFNFKPTKEFGALQLEWDGQLFPISYVIYLSDDARRWIERSNVNNGNGGKDYFFFPETDVKHLKIVMNDENPKYKIKNVKFYPADSALTINQFYRYLARDYPRGFFPRYIYGEQSYWTVIGAHSDEDEALINEEGQIELNKESASLMPFLRLNGTLMTWNEVILAQHLDSGYLPIPEVVWTKDGIRLSITAFTGGSAGSSSLFVRYRLTNLSPAQQKGSMYIAIRPFQVNPPWQNLNTVGGAAKVASLSYLNSQFFLNDSIQILFLTLPRNGGVITLNEGDVMDYILRGKIPLSKRVKDADGYASGLAVWDVDLAPGTTFEVSLVSPFHSTILPQSLEKNIRSLYRETKRKWQEELEKVHFHIPGKDSAYVDILKSNLAYILINKDGAAIQPGSRVYERSWIRDGVLTSGALLRLGHRVEIKDFLRWYAQYQFPSGKVPCVVDRRGADPVVENDSPGEFIYGVYEYYMFTRDTAFLREMYGPVRKALEYMDSLRHLRMTPEFSTPEKQIFYGLLPESISHEGYSAKPMHSYWDDFFALRGFQDVVRIAEILSLGDDYRKYLVIANEFKETLVKSFLLAFKKHRIDYVPGCAELGDFDATSTAIALNIGLNVDELPSTQLKNTFDAYFNFFAKRRSGQQQWENYTPYELRIVNAFVRLGYPERVHQLMEWFRNDQRPREWNHWAEVVWKEYRAPKMIGDMPHTWCGTEFILALRNMFVYEREADTTLVIGAGIKEEWIKSTEGVTAMNLPTYYGIINYKAYSRRGEATIEVSSYNLQKNTMLEILIPSSMKIRKLLLDGDLVTPTHKVAVKKIPVRIQIQY